MAQTMEIGAVATPQHAAKPERSRNCLIPGVHLPLLFVVAALAVYGLVVVYSAINGDSDYNFSRQVLGVILGVIAMIVVWLFDYRKLANHTWLLLIINVVLILSPHIPGIGTDAGTGAQSWINIGIQVQPGEFAKFTIILMDASIMARYEGKLDDLGEYMKALVLMLIPFFCILTQPDLGTGLVYVFIAAVALVVGGAKPKYLVVTLILAIAAVAGILVIDEAVYESTGEYVFLEEYQRNRLLVFIDPDLDPTGDGYNLTQAKIAIGNGGLFGAGWMQGTQHNLGLLPEAATDFIFCVLAEDFGFVGVLLLLGLYAALIFICYRIAHSSSDLFGLIAVMCVAGMWLFQILENIGMDCGLMPITGIPLPFMSYGSSFMLVNFMLVGLVGSVWARGGAIKTQ